MPYPQLTPYDILEVTPGITRDQLKKAYEQAIRRRKYPANTVTKAYNDLRSGRKRLETDIMLLSQSGDPGELVRFIQQLPPCEFISTNVAPFSLPYEQILMNEPVSEQHELDIPDNPYTTQLHITAIDPPKIIPSLAFPW